MKKSARNRIIIWSIVSVCLIAVLALGIKATRNFSLVKFNLFDINIPIDDLNSMDSGNASFAPETVNSIEVNWENGSVYVHQRDDVEDITISELSDNIIKDNDKMRYQLDENGTLKIYSGKSSFTFFDLFNGNIKEKELQIDIPTKMLDKGFKSDMKLENIEISTASAPVNVENLYSKDIDINTASGEINLINTNTTNSNITTVSGNITLENIKANLVDTESVSGKTFISGDYITLDSESISGNVKAVLGNGNADNLTNWLSDLSGNVSQEEIDINSVSGEIEVIAPEDISGFTMEYETVSGTFSSNFPANSSGSFSSGTFDKESEKKFSYGTINADSTKINLETVSGNIKITAEKE